MSVVYEIGKSIREIKDFPKEGIGFKDISPLLENPDSFRMAVDALTELFPENVDKIASIESRGFIFGAPIAYNLNCGFVMVRKPGKLPGDIHCETYDLEYGTDTLEIHKDAIKEGERVVIFDDLLATGGTVRATVNLVELCGGVVERIIFLLELGFLNGKDKLQGYDVRSLIVYDE